MSEILLSIGAQTSFKLRKALMIYGAEGLSRGSVFVSVHNVTEHQGGPPRLDAGGAVTEEFLKELVSGLRMAAPLQILPSNVLAFKDDTLMWWRPASKARVFFSEGTVASHLNGATIPFPATVFLVRNGGMYLRALRTSQRPDADTELFHAPFWNLSDDGGLCHGSMPNVVEDGVHSIAPWEAAFFDSAFTHPNNHSKVINHRKGMVGAWEQAIAKDAFLPKWLVPANETLQQFLRD